MPIINLEKQVESLPKDFEQLKPILRQLLSAVNTLHDTKNLFHGDVVFLDDNAGIVMRRQAIGNALGDQNWSRQIVTGVGSSALTFVDIGKERK